MLIVNRHKNIKIYLKKYKAIVSYKIYTCAALLCLFNKSVFRWVVEFCLTVKMVHRFYMLH